MKLGCFQLLSTPARWLDFHLRQACTEAIRKPARSNLAAWQSHRAMTTSAAAAPGPDTSVDPSPAKHMSAAQLHACLHVSVAPSRPLLRVNAHWNRTVCAPPEARWAPRSARPTRAGASTGTTCWRSIPVCGPRQPGFCSSFAGRRGCVRARRNASHQRACRQCGRTNKIERCLRLCACVSGSFQRSRLRLS